MPPQPKSPALTAKFYLDRMLAAHQARDTAKTDKEYWAAQEEIRKWKFLYDEADAEYKVRAFERSGRSDDVSLFLAVQADILNRCTGVPQQPITHPDGRQEFYVEAQAVNGEIYAARAPNLLEACLEVRKMLKKAGVTPLSQGK